MNNRTIGTQYEAFAADYLSKQGLRILERNFRCRAGEIDLIAMDGSILCFIEVKYRRTASCGFGSEAVDLRKQKRIITASEVYIQQTKQYDCLRRYDVFEIQGHQFRYLQNCFGGF